MAPCPAPFAPGLLPSVASGTQQAWSEADQCAVAMLVQGLAACATPQRCCLLWLVLSFKYARIIPNALKNVVAWSRVFKNVTDKLETMPAVVQQEKEVFAALHRRGGLGPRVPRDFAQMERESTLLIYADSEGYLEKPHVEPFVRHQGCYAAARGMRFSVVASGLPEDHHFMFDIGASAQEMSGWFVSAVGAEAATEETWELMKDVVNTYGSNRMGEFLRHPHFGQLRMNWRHPNLWGKIWSLEEELSKMKPDALLVFWDTDVTIRPDSWHRGIAELLLNKTASRPLAQDREGRTGHIFIADTWHGAECVNGGFTAFRNTEVTRLFLHAWRDKLSWAGTWNQGALAETILEFLGQEAKLRSRGLLDYRHQCKAVMLPILNGELQYGSYCECWQEVVRGLAGNYRERSSTTVSFVDPEHLETNFVAHNLFVNHNLTLSGMRLVPWDGLECDEEACRGGRLPALTPLAVHWAGIGRDRAQLMADYLQLRWSLSTEGCPRAPPAPRDDFGSRARHVRCCEFRRSYPLEEADPHTRSVSELFWGCHSMGLHKVSGEDCDLYAHGPPAV